MKNGAGIFSLIFMLVILAMVSQSLAIEVAPRISDKEIIEKLGKLEGDIKELGGELKAVRQEIETVRQELKGDIRELRGGLEAVKQELKGDIKEIKGNIKRIEEGQKNIEQQIDRLVNVFIGIVAAFAAIVAVTIGFAIWDRKTALQPAIAKSRELEKKRREARRGIERVC